MTLSQVASVLGLDETDGVSVVPLTDAEIAAAPRPNREQRRQGERRKRRQVSRALGSR